jgi:uncharacterized protein Veg
MKMEGNTLFMKLEVGSKRQKKNGGKVKKTNLAVN